MPPRVAYLGPPGTFTEQALRTQDDLVAGDLWPIESIPDVLDAVAAAEADVGLVAIENAIEGSVSVTVDSLMFDHDLLIRREVVIDVRMSLMAQPGVRLGEITSVLSIPIATAQCRYFLRKNLPHAEMRAANSTAEAARIVSEGNDPGCAAVAPPLSAELYGLDVVAGDIEDHQGNQTRFVLVGRSGIPPASGHDKTSLVVYQRADAPGSLLAILQEFSARSINLTKLESRPTKKGLGDYCFLIDFEGHISDEVVADCLRELKAKQGDVKFLGSYPAAGDHDGDVRRDAHESWTAAEVWLDGIRSQLA